MKTRSAWLLQLTLFVLLGLAITLVQSCGSSNSSPSSPSGPSNTATFTITFTTSNTPTKTPTLTPSFSPTNSPTITPTNSPTNSPTASPTSTPTNTPCTSPTQFGETTAGGGGGSTFSGTTFVQYSDFAPSSSGVLLDTQVNLAFVTSANAVLQTAVYTADGSGFPSSLVAVSNKQTVDTGGAFNWVSFDMPGQASLSAGTTYCLAFYVSSMSLNGYYNYTSTADQNFYIASVNGSDLSGIPTGNNHYSSLLAYDMYADYCP